MPALWHQTPSMQNPSASVYQQLAPQLSCCRGVHWWVTWLTRSRGDDTVDAHAGQNGNMDKEMLRKRDGWGWRLQMIIFEHHEGKSLAGDKGDMARRQPGSTIKRSICSLKNIIFNPLTLLMSICVDKGTNTKFHLFKIPYLLDIIEG